MTRPMRVATLLFFAIASLSLCLGALYGAGYAELATHLPIVELVLALAIAAPLTFLAWAVVEALHAEG